MAAVFSTKARTLALLQGRLASARISPLVFFTVEAWLTGRATCISDVQRNLGVGPWIVRSSCKGEDTASTSNAGAYLSVPDVTRQDLESAVDRVIASYGVPENCDEVLVQPMIRNSIRSGVAFSHDPNTCSPYRIVNWAEGDNTSLVTSGIGGRTWQQAANSPFPPLPELTGVFDLLSELLSLFGNSPIDCEFAVTSDEGKDVLWLLQVRPLVLTRDSESAESQGARLLNIQKRVERGMLAQPFLQGKKTVYGVMPDWNPAEIIGIRPKPLALSLYREVITDSIWAYQRNNYGYRNLRSFPLMPHFFGLPYIDVRVSFNSFVPADLHDDLASRLVDYYVDRLISEPTLHDKVEFEIVYSCYTLDLPDRLEGLAQAGFSGEERSNIADRLRHLTKRITHPKKGLWKEDKAKIGILNQRRESLNSSSADILAKIYWLIEDAKRYGTLPFAGLARTGFVAVQMLRSFVTVGIFSQSDYDAFLRGVSTVSGQLAMDRSTLDRSTFLARYGHLRPGTYDILSPRYDEAPELYFDWNKNPPTPETAQPFSLTLRQMRELVNLLGKHKLHTDAVELLTFLQSGIELREYAKFHFTRNISDALALIAQYGGSLGFGTADLAYCDFHVFKEIYVGADRARDLITSSIESGKCRYEETRKTSLPPLIVEPQNVWGFEWPETTPNYITQKQAIGQVVGVEARDQLAGAIICIPNADPGFDWLFAHPLAGLVTAWGGANSHMAIRAGELGLPAVIGVGEVQYRRLSNAQRLHMDCAGRRVEILE